MASNKKDYMLKYGTKIPPATYDLRSLQLVVRIKIQPNNLQVMSKFSKWHLRMSEHTFRSR